MTAQKREETILYDCKGQVCSKSIAEVYAPILFFEKPAKEYNRYPIIQTQSYTSLPILKCATYDKYALDIQTNYKN